MRAWLAQSTPEQLLLIVFAGALGLVAASQGQWSYVAMVITGVFALLKQPRSPPPSDPQS